MVNQLNEEKDILNNFGRTIKPVDWKKADELLMAGCLGTEIAAYFDMHPKTFYKKVEDTFGITFTEYSHEKKSKGESLLRAHQYAKALGLTDKGDNTLLIWLGKQRLGQRDKEKEEENVAPNQKIIDQADIIMKQQNEIENLKKENNASQRETSQELHGSNSSI